MHAFLLINHDPNLFAENNSAKIIPFVLQTVDDTKELKKLVKFSYSEKTAIVINDIDKATKEASNAFLKSLEEPNKNIIYILTASNLQNVLPTIISRCEIIQQKLIKNDLKNTEINYKDALNIKDRDQAIKFIEDLIFNNHGNEKNNVKNYLSTMTFCLETIRNLKQNGNVSLQLANFVARMNGHGK